MGEHEQDAAIPGMDYDQYMDNYAGPYAFRGNASVKAPEGPGSNYESYMDKYAGTYALRGTKNLGNPDSIYETYMDNNAGPYSFRKNYSQYVNSTKGMGDTDYGSIYMNNFAGGANGAGGGYYQQYLSQYAGNYAGAAGSGSPADW